MITDERLPLCARVIANLVGGNEVAYQDPAADFTTHDRVQRLATSRLRTESR